MGVGIDLRWRAMGGPPGVGNAGRALQRGLFHDFAQMGHIALVLENLGLFLIVNDGDPGAVVSSVFQSL